MKKLFNAVLVAATILFFGVIVAAAFSPPAKAEVFSICPSGLTGVATPDTSCPFADNVRRAWYGQPGTTVIAYSPVTELFYTMQCQLWITDAWIHSKRCFGVNSFGAVLIVYIA